MRYDVHPPLGHPEVAGWVLGALDGAEAETFGEHLWSCAQCQASAAEFEAVATALDRPVPADEPPPGLEARVLAAVQQAAMTPARPEEHEEYEEPEEHEGAAYPEEREEAAVPPQIGSTWHAVQSWRVVDAPQRDQAPWLEEVPRLDEVPRLGETGPRPAARQAKTRRRWRPNNRLLAAAAAAIVAGATFFGFEVSQGATPAAATIALSARAGVTGSGTATARRARGGWSMQLTEHNLKKLAQGEFYECWYMGPADRPGHRQLITAGTFTVDRDGSETFTMWSAADPHRYRIAEITAESPGDGGQHGKVVLEGTVRTG